VTRTAPSLSTQNPGNLVASTALWNIGPKATGDFFLAPPLFRGRQTTLQSAPSGSWQAQGLQVADLDTDGGHSNVTNNSRYNCQVPGWYFVEGFAAWVNGGAQGRMDAAIVKNGSIVSGSQSSVVKQNIDFGAVVAAALVQLKIGDYTEVWGMQSTGSTINTAPNGDLCPCLNVMWIHP
jgi:hypothetical protein